MTRPKALKCLPIGLALLLSGCPQKAPTGPGPSSSATTAGPVAASPAQGQSMPTPLAVALDNALKPLPDKEGRFPVLTQKSTVNMVTSEGTIVLEVYPEAAPNAVARFLELVESGFYNDIPVSRVVKVPAPFVAQFGINWRKPHNAWEKKTFKDDSSLFSLERGTLCFAKADIDQNGTQVFINLRENNALAVPELNFTAFGKVVKGMEIVDRFPTVGEADEGLNQYRLWTGGEAYLESLTTKPAMIEKMTVVKPK